MESLHLKTSQIFQGSFTFGKLNLLLVFQVNCPGCFLSALPMAAHIHNRYGDRLQVLGLSTAFEDFSLNTPEGTQRLLESGELVGATKQFFQHRSIDFSTPIAFPVAFDLLGAGRDVFTDDDVDCIYQAKSAALQLVGLTSDDVRLRLKQLLHNRPIVAYSFSVNQLQGTPSWLLFDDRQRVLARWFGHKPEAEVTTIIEWALETLPANGCFAA